MKTYGGMDVQSHIVLTSALNGDWWEGGGGGVGDVCQYCMLRNNFMLVLLNSLSNRPTHSLSQGIAPAVVRFSRIH